MNWKRTEEGYYRLYTDGELMAQATPIKEIGKRTTCWELEVVTAREKGLGSHQIIKADWMGLIGVYPTLRAAKQEAATHWQSNPKPPLSQSHEANDEVTAREANSRERAKDSDMTVV